jgi:uncharacterized membrane protein YeiH
MLASTNVEWWSGWKLHGSFTSLDLIAASTNALNGALLVRRPDHYKHFTIVGVLLMALFMGVGGGITRDVIVGEVPGAVTNPAYLVLCLLAGFVGYKIAFAEGKLFREGLFQFVTALSLPLYAIVAAQKGVAMGLPVMGVLLLSVIGPTAGRWYVDVSCGVAPKHFVRGEWFVSIALLTGFVWVLCASAGWNTWVCTTVAFAVGYTVRIAALYRGWEEPLAPEPAGVYLHGDGRPHLGRRLQGKSQHELRSLGLVVEEEDGNRNG